MPLPGKRVLVTRAAHQASALGDALAARGLTVVAIPALRLEPPGDGYAALDHAIETLDGVDWIVFTSSNAVEAFQARMEELGCDDVPCRIASIGEATSRTVRAAGLQVDLQPPRAVAESLAAALRPHAAGARVLMVRAESARDVIPQAMQQAGAQVSIVPAYRTVVPAESVDALRRELPRLDAITFTSSSSVRNLLELADATGVTLPDRVVLASIGPITSQTLRECGYTPHLEAPVADVETLASIVARHFSTT